MNVKSSLKRYRGVALPTQGKRSKGQLRSPLYSGSLTLLSLITYYYYYYYYLFIFFMITIIIINKRYVRDSDCTFNAGLSSCAILNFMQIRFNLASSQTALYH